MGDVVAAVDRYQDIPAEVRQRLKRRMAERRYDDIARIDRDSISGRYTYDKELREMHFANGQVCARVGRERWPAGATERGLVYCESGHCIIVPTVCRNVARITRLSERVAGDAAAGDDALLARSKPSGGAGAGAVAAPGPGLELRFDPPAAGPPPTVAAPPAASFEQLNPGLGAAPISTPPSAVAAPGPASPLGSVAAAIASTTPAVVAAPVLNPAPGSPAPLGNLGNVLPVMAWTTPFGPGPVPATPRDTAGNAQPVPEPGTWAMWLAGLAVVAYLVRRRKR